MSHSKQKISANLFNQFFILFNAPKHKQKRIPFTYYNDVAVLVMLINATLEEDILKSLFIITQKSYKKYHLLLYAYNKNETHRYGYINVKESNILFLTVYRAIRFKSQKLKSNISRVLKSIEISRKVLMGYCNVFNEWIDMFITR